MNCDNCGKEVEFSYWMMHFGKCENCQDGLRY